MWFRKKMDMYFFSPLRLRFIETNFYLAFILIVFMNLLIVIHEYIKFSNYGVGYKVVAGTVAYVDGNEFGLFGVGGYRFKSCLLGKIKNGDKLDIRFVDDFKNKKIIFDNNISPVAIFSNGVSICGSRMVDADVVNGKKLFLIIYILITTISTFGYIGFCKKIKENG